VSAGEKMLLVPEAAALDGASAIGAIGDGMAVGLEAEDGWEERVRQLKPPPEGTAIVVPFDLTPKDYTIEGWRQAYANAVRLNVQLRAERDAAVADRDRLRGEEGGADCDCGGDVPGAGCLDVGALHALRKGYALEARVNNERFQETLRLRAECDRLLRQVMDVTDERNAAYMKIARYMVVLRGEDYPAVLAVRNRLAKRYFPQWKDEPIPTQAQTDECTAILREVGQVAGVHWPDGALAPDDPHAGGAECGRPDCRCHLGGRP